jgi:phospholipase/carboxylesterase
MGGIDTIIAFRISIEELSPMAYLPCEELNPKQTATAAVIWLHGLGANGHDFVPVVPELLLPDHLAIRFVFPHAPQMPVTVNNGYVMPSWYDILSFDWGGDEDDSGNKRHINPTQFAASVSAIQALIDREITRGVNPERILLVGFSQGGAIAYEAALSYGQSLGGMLALSTYLQSDLATPINPANQHLPIQIMHGSNDTVVLEMMGQRAFTALQLLGLAPHYKNYPMGHEVYDAEINDISAWIQQRLCV